MPTGDGEIWKTKLLDAILLSLYTKEKTPAQVWKEVAKHVGITYVEVWNRTKEMMRKGLLERRNGTFRTSSTGQELLEIIRRKIWEVFILATSPSETSASFLCPSEG